MGVEDGEGDAALSAEVLQVGAVGLVGDVVHHHVHSFHLDVRLVDAGSLGKKTCEHERVLASAEGDENAVAIMQQGVLYARLVE